MSSKNKIKIITFLLCIVLFVIIYLILTFPRDILKSDNNDMEIILAEYNAAYGKNEVNMVEIIGKDEELIGILKKYKEKTIFKMSDGYSFTDVEIRICLRDGDDIKEMLLGADNYINRSHGEFKSEIINADDLKNELIVLISNNHMRN